MKRTCLICCIALTGVLTACFPSPIINNRNYAAKMTVPANLDYKSHPDASRFQTLLNETVDKGLPGIAMLVKSPAGLWIGSGGQSDLNRNLPFDSFTRSRLGSVTKTFIATATLKLAEEGLLGLDEPISKYLDPDIASKVANSNKITIRQLLNHTSGLPKEPMTVSPVRALEMFTDDPYREVSVKEYLSALYGVPPLFAPGKSWSYSNFGYSLLGQIIGKVTGQDQWKMVHSRVLAPLGLTDTFFDENERVPPGTARGYADLYGNGTLTDTSDMDAIHPLDAEGGMVSNVYDLYRFLDALFNGNLLKKSSMTEMLTCVKAAPDEGLDAYGLGLGCTPVDGKPTYNHIGLVMGYVCIFYFYPEQKTIVTILVNVSHGKVLTGLEDLFKKKLPPLIK